jgi:hypothetical protein
VRPPALERGRLTNQRHRHQPVDQNESKEKQMKAASMPSGQTPAGGAAKMTFRTNKGNTAVLAFIPCLIRPAISSRRGGQNGSSTWARGNLVVATPRSAVRAYRRLLYFRHGLRGSPRAEQRDQEDHWQSPWKVKERVVGLGHWGNAKLW